MKAYSFGNAGCFRPFEELMSTASSRDSRVEAAHTLLEGRVQSLQEQLESLREDLEATVVDQVY